jgi:hypothetical protein
LIDQTKKTVPTPLDPKNYGDRDRLSLKLDVLKQYLELRERAPHLPTAVQAADVDRQADSAQAPEATAEAGSTPGVPTQDEATALPAIADTTSVPKTAQVKETAYDRLSRRRKRLSEDIGPESYSSLRNGLLFVREMQEDIYADEILVAQVDKGALSITTIPQAVEADQPVELALKFQRDDLNICAARREWECTWDFGDDSPPECGWEVTHCYSKPAVYDPKVTIIGLRGDAVTKTPISGKVRVAPRFAEQSSAENVLEGARLGLILVVAVVGLMATARQQIQSLTFLQAVGLVFGLGFAADSLKNLITQKVAGQPPSPTAAK